MDIIPHFDNEIFERLIEDLMPKVAADRRLAPLLLNSTSAITVVVYDLSGRYQLYERKGQNQPPDEIAQTHRNAKRVGMYPTYYLSRESKDEYGKEGCGAVKGRRFIVSANGSGSPDLDELISGVLINNMKDMKTESRAMLQRSNALICGFDWYEVLDD